jgi:hypothetical protein
MHSVLSAAVNRSVRYGITLAAAAALTLSGCGGGSSGATASSTITGKFVDATVVGLGYKCGTSAALSGSTNANGEFTCKTGEAVSFWVGGIKLGSIASAQAVVTPLDLVGAGATPSDTTVNNMVRFLMSISSTAAASGTLTIDPAVVTAAASKEIDFAKVLAADLDATIQAVKPTATLATVQEATDHMASSVYGLFVGSYAGSYSGTTSGTWSVAVDSKGVVSGTGTDSTGSVYDITGNMATTVGTSSSYSFSGDGGGSTWTGTLNLITQQFSGTWTGGTFTGKASTPAAAAPSTSANSGGTLIVSGVTPSTGNGNFSLPIATETAAGGTSTMNRVEFTDATPATRTLRLYYEPSTGALKNIQYESKDKSFNCAVGEPLAPCDTSKITFSATGKSILLDLAEFKVTSTSNGVVGTTVNGVLEGLMKW